MSTPLRGAALSGLVFGLALASWSAAAAQGEGDPEHGGQIYVENCAVCHGLEGQGRIGASLEAFSGIDPGAVIAATVADGISGSVMPAWSTARGGPLSDQDIDDVVAYIIEAFDGNEPIAPAPTYIAPDIEPLPDVEGDPSQGAVIFHANCQVCHGERGEGRIGKPLRKTWPGPEPASFIRTVVTEGIAGTVMPPWAQSQGGPLTDEEVASVAAFVLTFEEAPSPAAPETGPGPISSNAVLIAVAVLVALALIVGVLYYRQA